MAGVDVKGVFEAGSRRSQVVESGSGLYINRHAGTARGSGRCRRQCTSTLKGGGDLARNTGPPTVADLDLTMPVIGLLVAGV